MKGLLRLIVLVGCTLAITPALALAQSAIAGAVTDTTGAVLPGVTVEARSPVLIEQVRTGVTDGSGQYRIVGLVPGTYTITFTMPGFASLVREGIRLDANFTAPVSVQMQVGALEETVTVSGASPVVDVQSTQRREVVSRDFAEALPTGRSFETVARTLPAVTSERFDVGGASQAQQGRPAAYGSRGAGDLSTTMDGLKIDSPLGNGGLIANYMNAGGAQEYSFVLNGGGAETQTGGVQIQIISREGGNRFSGDNIAIYTNGSLQGNNLSDTQKTAFGTPGSLVRLWDYNFNLGGPIVRNKLWFFVSTRTWGYDNRLLNLFHDGTMGPRGEQVADGNLLQGYVGRLTWQATPILKITARQERGPRDRDYFGIEAGNVRPEASTYYHNELSYLAAAKATATLSSKLLFDVGFSLPYHRALYGYQEGNAGGIQKGFTGPKFPSATNPYGDIPKSELGGTGPLAGKQYGNKVEGHVLTDPRYYIATTLSYVTGTHALKGGYQGSFRSWQTNDYYSYHNFRQRYLNGRPNSVELFSYPFLAREEFVDHSLFVQDTWTHGRLTLNGGVRYDYFRGWVPASVAPASANLPERRFAEVPDVPLWHDISPRFGGAYALNSSSKTVVKGSVGRYVWQEAVAFPGRFQPLTAQTDTRIWNDLNSNDIAERSELGPSTNAAFGTDARTRFPGSAAKIRPYDMLYNLALEHELRQGLGLSVSYNRRSSKRLSWTENRATAFSDYTLLSVPDPRGNGQTLPVYNISAAKQAARNQFDEVSTNSAMWQGYDFSVHGRFGSGLILQGGTSTGRPVNVTCQTSDPNVQRFCDQGQFDIPYKTTFKMAAVSPAFKGFALSAVYQSIAGLERTINYAVTRTVLPTLTLASVTVRLNEPGNDYLDRVNQLDVSLSGTIKTGPVQLKPSVDLFNATNSNPVLQSQDNFGAALGSPIRILDARLVRLMMTVSF